jgi:hypothetical protein
MGTLSKINLENLMIQCTQNMSGIGPDYDELRINTYFKLDKNLIVNFLADNWTNVEYDTEKLSKLINITDEQILDDLKQVLIISLKVNFNGGYTKNGYMRKNIEIVYEEEKEKLKLILYKQLQNLLFKRTVKTCTPYGFM